MYVTEAESPFGDPGAQALLVIEPRDPFAGLDTIENVRSHVPVSVPVRVTTAVASSLVVTVLFAAVGAVFVGVSRMVPGAGLPAPLVFATTTLVLLDA